MTSSILIKSLTIILYVFVFKVKYVYFNDDQCLCASNFKDNVETRYKTAETVIGFILNVVPCVVLILTNCLLILLAVLKTHRQINKQNMTVVLVVTLVFLTTTLPYYVFYTIHPVWDGVDTPGLRAVSLVVGVNMFANPIVYLVTNEQFRQFTVSKLRLLSSASQIGIADLQNSQLSRDNRSR